MAPPGVKVDTTGCIGELQLKDTGFAVCRLRRRRRKKCASGSGFATTVFDFDESKSGCLAQMKFKWRLNFSSC
jgi:hypothetical protein